MKRFLSGSAGLSGRNGPVLDVHQHLWPEALIEALRARRTSPRIRGWDLELPGEPPYPIDPAAHLARPRRELDAEDGVDLTLLAPSSPLGLEYLDPDQAAPLIDGWNTRAGDLGAGHALWAAFGMRDPDLKALAATLALPGVCGLQVPATGWHTPASLVALAPVLALAEAAGKPVFVHPGPVLDRPDAGSLPGWWPAMTSYLAQLQAAWLSWQIAGRGVLPRLRVLFAALAGLAPLHHERLAQRGGALGPIDPEVYYETSSYGARAVDAVARVVGVDPLVHGSDRPYAEPADPGLGDAFAHALLVANPARLLAADTLRCAAPLPALHGGAR